MRVYISGPITGRADRNVQAFDHAAAQLSRLGFDSVNPHDVGKEIDTGFFSGDEARWLAYMRADIKALVDCDALIMLDGWQFSRGATIEAILARDLGIPVFYSIDALESHFDMLEVCK